MGRITNFSLNLPSTGVHTSFSGVRVSQSLVFCVVYCRSLFVPLSDYWPLYYMSLYNLRPLITPVVFKTCGRCLVCPCMIYGLWLPLWYLKLLVIVLSVLVRFMASDYPCGIFKLLVIFFSVLVRLTASDYPCGILKLFILVFSPCSTYGLWLPLWYLKTCGRCLVCPCMIYGLWLPLWYLKTVGHCLVCPCSIYGLWLPLWYLQTFGHCLVCPCSM